MRVRTVVTVAIARGALRDHGIAAVRTRTIVAHENEGSLMFWGDPWVYPRVTPSVTSAVRAGTPGGLGYRAGQGRCRALNRAVTTPVAVRYQIVMCSRCVAYDPDGFVL
ncbi:hypothetical protein GCM10009722_34940 [Williamsia deligens]